MCPLATIYMGDENIDKLEVHVSRHGNTMRIVVGNPMVRGFKFATSEFSDEQLKTLRLLDGFTGRNLGRQFKFEFKCTNDSYPNTQSKVLKVIDCMKKFIRENEAIDRNINSIEHMLNKEVDK